MAATIARATGVDTSGRQKEVTRLGSHCAQVEAATWETFASAEVRADGSGYVLVRRNGRTILHSEFGPEEKE